MTTYYQRLTARLLQANEAVVAQKKLMHDLGISTSKSSEPITPEQRKLRRLRHKRDLLACTWVMWKDMYNRLNSIALKPVRHNAETVRGR